MRVTVTGATGLIGTRIVRALRARGDEVTVLSRRPERARETLGVDAAAWQPDAEPAPADALAGRDGVVHLAGETIAQRWSEEAQRAIRTSRELGTRNLVAGIRASDPRPGVLVSASGVDYYGDRGDEPVSEEAAPGDTWLASVCVAWEREAAAAEELDVRVVRMRSGIALDKGGGALARMLPFFRLGIGGPVAGGRQYMPWIAADDLVAMYIAALDGADWSGPVNAVAPDPPTNAEFSRALGRALRRPAFAPVPAFAIRLLYGQMADIVIQGRRAAPARARELGFTYAHPDLEDALRAAT
jgi:uncharacterized protein